jgi:hypothetical protein
MVHGLCCTRDESYVTRSFNHIKNTWNRIESKQYHLHPCWIPTRLIYMKVYQYQIKTTPDRVEPPGRLPCPLVRRLCAHRPGHPHRCLPPRARPGRGTASGHRVGQRREGSCRNRTEEPCRGRAAATGGRTASGPRREGAGALPSLPRLEKELPRPRLACRRRIRASSGSRLPPEAMGTETKYACMGGNLSGYPPTGVF